MPLIERLLHPMLADDGGLRLKNLPLKIVHQHRHRYHKPKAKRLQ
ncbi:MAG: hypothetical protein WC340_06025 [Kiritimatiellia bacterium]